MRRREIERGVRSSPCPLQGWERDALVSLFLWSIGQKCLQPWTHCTAPAEQADLDLPAQLRRRIWSRWEGVRQGAAHTKWHRRPQSWGVGLFLAIMVVAWLGCEQTSCCPVCALLISPWSLHCATTHVHVQMYTRCWERLKDFSLNLCYQKMLLYQNWAFPWERVNSDRVKF